MSRDPIQDLVHRYADAVVNHDGEQWGSTWSENAEWSLGPGREVAGRDAIVAFWHKAMSGLRAVVQNCLNGTYELDEAAGTGTGRWYIQEAMERGDGTRVIMLGHYDDKYVRENGQWLFADRRLVVHYGGPPDLTGDFHNVIVTA